MAGRRGGPGAEEPGDGSEDGFDTREADSVPGSGFDAGGADDGPESGLDAVGAGDGSGIGLHAAGANDEPQAGPGGDGPGDGSEDGFDTGEADSIPGSGFDAGWPDAAVAALKAAAERFKALSASEWRGEVEAFARRLPDAVRVTVLEADPPPVRAPTLPEGPPPVLAAREPGRPLRRIRQLTSFTALSAEAFAAGSGRPAVEGGGAEVDRPDHDQYEAPADDAGEDTEATGRSGARAQRVHLPEGAGGGKLSAPDLRTAGRAAGNRLERARSRRDLPRNP